MKIFAIIVTFNGIQWCDRCFGSLRNSKIPIDTVIIDNGSNDGTVDFIKENYPEIHIVENHENLGFGKANNLGMRYALDHGADYVFLLNQDAWIEPDTVENLVRIHQEHPEYGILSPMHLNAEKNGIEHLLLGRLDDHRTTDPALFEDLYFGRLKEVYETKYVNAAAWLLQRKTLETVGGFDPLFFIYGEDDNYINRVLYHGMKIGICPKTRLVHDNNRPRPLYESREHEVLMMIEYTDVNKTHHVRGDMRQHWLKTITSFVKGRKAVAKRHYANYLWLKKNRKAIENSILTNKQPGLNWL